MTMFDPVWFGNSIIPLWEALLLTFSAFGLFIVLAIGMGMLIFVVIKITIFIWRLLCRT